MPTPRSDLATLSLTATPSNFKKAVRLREQNPDPQLSDPETIQQLLTDARQQYEIAMTDVQERGTVIEVTRYTSKGKSYTTEELNPYYRVAAKLSSQIAKLTLMLAKLGPKKKTDDVIPGSAQDLYPEIFKTEQPC
jgi:hypothetical protein